MYEDLVKRLRTATQTLAEFVAEAADAIDELSREIIGTAILSITAITLPPSSRRVRRAGHE